MRRALLQLTLLVLAALAVGMPADRAWSQEPATAPPAADRSPEAELKERIQRIRELPREDQVRLREALRRFKKLTPDQRDKLRKKADRVGRTRLRELAGRDLKRLRKRHGQLKKEMKDIWGMAVGEARRDQFTPQEQAYLRHTAMRRFQHHVKNDLLKRAGVIVNARADRQMLKKDRRARMQRAVKEVAKQLYEEEYTAEQRAQFELEPPQRVAQLKRHLVLEYRQRLAIPFANQFDRGFVAEFLRATPEERAERVAGFQRERQWYELARLGRQELRLSRDTLRQLRELDAADWAQLRASYARRKAAGMDPERITLEITSEIQSLYSRSPGAKRSDRSKLREALREGRPRGKWDGSDAQRRRKREKMSRRKADRRRNGDERDDKPTEDLDPK